MFKRFKSNTELKIVADNFTHTLYPGDKYTLNVNVDFSKNTTSIIVKAPITFSWDGYTLMKIDGP